MNIGLDYDDTYTADTELWDRFISMAEERGHTVLIVTMRFAHETVNTAHPVIYTGHKAKKPLCEALGIMIDIWIDDKPQYIIQDKIR